MNINSSQLIQGKVKIFFKIRDVIVKKISAGGHHTMFLSDEGFVYTCGSANDGQLGLKTKKNVRKPSLVYSLTNK